MNSKNEQEKAAPGDLLAWYKNGKLHGIEIYLQKRTVLVAWDKRYRRNQILHYVEGSPAHRLLTGRTNRLWRLEIVKAT